MSLFKLIAAYKADPTLTNAQKLARHTRKHPMTSCALYPGEELTTYNAAMAHAEKGE